MSHHIPRKRFGQNFLIDREIIYRIIEAINPQATDHVVEIGPGLGALTVPLLARLPHLAVIEIDRDIVARLEKKWSSQQLSIYSIDALKFDFASLGKELRIIGNLPYNISTPLLFHLSSFSDSITDLHFMLQKEVVDRMVAAPSTADYGRLSVMLQYRFEMEKMLDVPPEAFDPAPKVSSAIVRMIPLRERKLALSDEGLFAQVVMSAFSQRRKTLRNTLKPYLDDQGFTVTGIDANLRGEDLALEQFVDIANYISAHPKILNVTKPSSE